MRPVKNVTDAVTVKFKLKLSQLIDVVSCQHFTENLSHADFIAEPEEPNNDNKPVG